MPEFVSHYIHIITVIVLSTGLIACQKPEVSHSVRTNSNLDHFPATILWAWERSEDLRFLDPDKFAVAFLAQTLKLKNNEVDFQPRRQTLKVSPDTRLIAVTRIETVKNNGHTPGLSKAQLDEGVQRILNTLKLKNVSAIQIDFDAKVSERGFYQNLLNMLRNKLPKEIPLSITALASFCLGDPWINQLPVDEAVPMVFRMGVDDKTIKKFLADGNDFPVSLCQQSMGIATDEILPINFTPLRRIYVFKSSPEGWTEIDTQKLNQLRLP